MSKPICPECKCETIYYRSKTNTYLCRRCGATWPKEISPCIICGAYGEHEDGCTVTETK